ncbi:LysR family transcriptional regulator, partial [Cellulomonas citrea]|uniref:LysR family transcriptional regulator n=1 Tax=Cellulomonas citrea TaxID=1909423 RepID=UPI0013590B77
MDLRQMEYVVALADEQQFTRAAAICGVSQSGLSAAIRALEDELGTALFARTTRRVEATDAGLALLPHARAVLAE